MANMKKRAVVAISGASGVIYGLRLLKMLLACDCQIYCTVTGAARKIAALELGSENIHGLLEKMCSPEEKNMSGKLNFYDNADFSAPMASGSFKFDAMAVIPCSMKTLGKIAYSAGDCVAVRAAEVALKERRRLVVVPRETPLALTHLRAMCSLSEAGAVVLPACPAFYNSPKSAEDFADFIAAKTLNAMGFEQEFLKEWGV